MEKITLKINGMACGGCATTIANTLLKLDGVIAAEVSHTAGLAEISFDPAKIQPDRMKSAIEATGYQLA